MYVCKSYFFKGSPFKWHCVFRWRFDLNATSTNNIWVFTTKNVLSERIFMLWNYFFSVTRVFFTFVWTLLKWKYFRGSISTNRAEDSDDINTTSCTIINAAISLEIGKLDSGDSRILGNVSYESKQLFRKNEEYGRKTDIQLHPPVCLGVDVVEQSTLLGSRRDGMAIISKMRCSWLKKFPLQINETSRLRIGK